MATDISKVNNKVVISEDSHEPEHLSGVTARYRFYAASGTDMLLLRMYLGSGEVLSRSIALSDLRVSGSVTAPATKADALTALDAVFPDPGTGTSSGGAVADQETITGEGTEAIPFAVANPLIDTDEQKWNDSFALAAGGTSRIVSGAAPWDSGLVFNVIGTVYPELVYYILGTRYTAAPTQKTLAAADATNPRIDVIYFDTSSAVGVLTGTPAANPAKPTVDSNTQVELTSITVPANATTPDTTDNLTVYNENTEFVVASTNGTLNANATATPAIGTKHISIGSFTNNQNITFTDTSLHDTSQFQYFTFRIRLGATFTASTFLSVRFANGASAVSNDVNIATGTFGWIRTVVGSYQFISIPIDRFTFTNSQFNRIYFILHGSNTTGFAIDNVVLQGGITIPSPNILSNALADEKMFIGRSGIATAVYGSNNIANVLDYGADATGATDSTAAFNLAKAAKKRVYAPTGTYLISAVYLTAGVSANHKGIELADGTELFGDGWGKTIIKLSDNASATTVNSFFYPIINGHGKSNCIVRDLEINGNKANQGNYLTNPYTNPTGYYADPANRWSTPGVMFKDGDNNQVCNVYVHDSQNNGIYYYNCTRCYVRDCKGSANGGSAVTYHVDCDGVIERVLATGNNSDQIRVDYCDAGKIVTVKNSEASFSGSDAGATNWFAGIYCEASANVFIDKCYSHDNSAYGIDMSATTINWNISNCLIEYNGNSGIVGTDNGIIKGNILYNNAKKRNGDIDTVSNYNQGAITIHSSHNLIIEGNRAIDDRTPIVQTYFIKNWGGGGSTGFSNSTVLNNQIKSVADIAHLYDGDDGTNIILSNQAFTSAGTLINPSSNARVWTINAGIPSWQPVSGSGASADVQTFTGNGTWTNPANAKIVKVVCIAGGGGGGSGAKAASGAARSGGSGGGSGAFSEAVLDATLLTSTVTVTVGAGGAGGASVTANSTAGNDGVNGVASSFGSYLFANLGAKGLGGSGSNRGGGAAGLGKIAGTAGGGSTTSAAGSAGAGASVTGATGGGGGAGMAATPALLAGGNGGKNSYVNGGGSSAAALGGTTQGQNGADGFDNVAGEIGEGGGGGANSTTTNAGAGGAGGNYGAGGGGGGCALDSTGNSGAGGSGGPGIVLVITYF